MVDRWRLEGFLWLSFLALYRGKVGLVIVAVVLRT